MKISPLFVALISVTLWLVGCAGNTYTEPDEAGAAAAANTYEPPPPSIESHMITPPAPVTAPVGGR